MIPVFALATLVTLGLLMIVPTDDHVDAMLKEGRESKPYKTLSCLVLWSDGSRDWKYVVATDLHNAECTLRDRYPGKFVAIEDYQVI